jgi:hypothetical protein
VPLSLGFFAVVVGALAWTTQRALHTERRRMESNRAINLLVLAKASALVGALMAGAYVGYALTFLQSWEVPVGRDRVIHSVVAAVAAVGVMVAALALERACKIPDDGDDDGMSSARGQPGASP